MIAPNSNCYWCGAAPAGREHVPPQTLFPKAKKVNLITVPACRSHNQDLSKLDEKFRVFLQALDPSPDAVAEFASRTFRGLNRPESAGLVKGLAAAAHPVVIQGKKTFAFAIDPSEQALYFEKMFRALYFHLYNSPFEGFVSSFSPQFVTPNLDYGELALRLESIFADQSIWRDGATSNRDIFHFRYTQIAPEPEVPMVILLTFYTSIQVVGFLTGSSPDGGQTEAAITV